MRAAQIPCGEVRTVGAALRSKEATARGLVTRIEHPVVGWVPNIAMPIRYSSTPMVDPKPAPAVGQHTDEVLAEVLGYDQAKLEQLRATGALSATPSKAVHAPAEPAVA
jgi:crotonobetainyl-CoA:carnitine CoA-transferase CaiB-like acyl-CoA transferase